LPRFLFIIFLATLNLFIDNDYWVTSLNPTVWYKYINNIVYLVTVKYHPEESTVTDNKPRIRNQIFTVKKYCYTHVKVHIS
jgi:hypothetical protein